MGLASESKEEFPCSNATGAEKRLRSLAFEFQGKSTLVVGGTVIVQGPTDARSQRLVETLQKNISASLVVIPANVEEVQKCIRHAGEFGLSVSAIGGFHTDYGTGGNVVLDMQNFTSIDVDADGGFVTVGGGSTLGPIQKAILHHGFMLPLGTAPTVGVGLVLGGGVGHLTRFSGLALDRVVSAEIVLADGSSISASAASNPDLLWAVRGCGPKFGVVHSLTLRPVPAVSFMVRRTFAKFAQKNNALLALQGYAARSCELPRHMNADCIVYHQRDGTLAVHVSDYRLELADADNDHALVGTAISEVAGDSVEISESTNVSVVDLMGSEPYLIEQPAGVLSDDPFKLGYKGVGIFFASPLPPTILSEVVKQVDEAPSKSCLVLFQHMGGAVADRWSEETAFFPRSAEWCLVVFGCWPADAGEAMGIRVAEWVKTFCELILPQSIGVYSVSVGPGDVNFAHHAYGSNLEKLQRLKTKWDPQNMFTYGFPLPRCPETFPTSVAMRDALRKMLCCS